MLLRVNEQRNILHEIRKRKANWIGQILRRNCLLKQVIEGKIKGEMEVARRRGRRRKKLLDDPKDRRGYSNLEEALDRTMWRSLWRRVWTCRQTECWMNVIWQSNTTFYCIKCISKLYLNDNDNYMFRHSFLTRLQYVTLGYFSIQLTLLLSTRSSLHKF